jgi:putative peptidoglycan lipid II flippase
MSANYKTFFLRFFSANFIVRFLGLIKDMMFGWIIGPSKMLDIFFFLIALPAVLNSTWNKALETVFLSRYEQDIHVSDSQHALQRFKTTTYNFTIISLVIYLVISSLFPFIIYYYYPLYVTPFLVRIVFIINLVFVLETFLLSIKVKCFSGQRFFLPTILPISQSVVIILGLLVYEKLSLLMLAILFTLGALLQFGFFLHKEFRYFLKIKLFTFNFGVIKAHLKGVSQLALASGLSSLNLLIDQAFALKLGEGANTYIHYGNYFLIIFTFLVVNNISTIFFPQFQKYVLQNQTSRLEADTQKVTRILLVISTAIVILLVNNGYFFLNLILGYGQMSADDLHMIYYCALGYSGAFLGLGLNAILVRILHVYRKYQIIVWVALTNAVLNVGFNIIFTKWFGVWGIALSTSVTLLILISIYIIYVYRTLNLNVFKHIHFSWIRRFSIAMIIVTWIEVWFFRTYHQLTGTDLFRNLMVFIASIAILAIIFLVLRVVQFKKYRIEI